MGKNEGGGWEKGYKKEAPQLIDANNLDATSEIGSADASENNVPQSKTDVKSNAVVFEYIKIDEVVTQGDTHEGVTQAARSSKICLSYNL